MWLPRREGDCIVLLTVRLFSCLWVCAHCPSSVSCAAIQCRGRWASSSSFTVLRGQQIEITEVLSQPSVWLKAILSWWDIPASPASRLFSGFTSSLLNSSWLFACFTWVSARWKRPFTSPTHIYTIQTLHCPSSSPSKLFTNPTRRGEPVDSPTSVSLLYPDTSR